MQIHTFPFLLRRTTALRKRCEIWTWQTLRQNGHKYGNTLLTSIRVGRSKLNSDNYKLGLSDSNLCTQKPETALHFITKCPNFAEQRRTVLDQIEQQFIPKFKTLSFNRQFEILVEGFEPDNPEMKRINSQIQKITQTFILQTKRFLDKPTTPLPPPLDPPNHILP